MLELGASGACPGVFATPRNLGYNEGVSQFVGCLVTLVTLSLCWERVRYGQFGPLNLQDITQQRWRLQHWAAERGMETTALAL